MSEPAVILLNLEDWREGDEVEIQWPDGTLLKSTLRKVDDRLIAGDSGLVVRRWGRRTSQHVIGSTIGYGEVTVTRVPEPVPEPKSLGALAWFERAEGPAILADLGSHEVRWRQGGDWRSWIGLLQDYGPPTRVLEHDPQSMAEDIDLPEFS
jgi:hypothetical protein